MGAAPVLLADAGATALTIVLAAAIVIGWVGLVALWWFGFRGRGPD